MNILSLDIASVTGWALDADDVDSSDNPEYGSIKFAGSLGIRAFVFERWLERIVTDRRVTTLAIEAPIPASGNTNMDTQLWLYGAFVTARKFAAARKIPTMVVSVQTWRSFYTGYARAPNVDPETGEVLAGTRNAGKRRAWIKKKTVAKCREHGWNPEDDNAADALGLLTYCLACFDPKHGMDPAELYAEAA